MILTITSSSSIVESRPPRTEQPSSIPTLRAPEVALYESPSKPAAEGLGGEQQHWAWRSPPRSYLRRTDSDLDGGVSSQALNVVPAVTSHMNARLSPSPVREDSSRDGRARREAKKDEVSNEWKAETMVTMNIPRVAFRHRRKNVAVNASRCVFGNTAHEDDSITVGC